MFGNSPAAVETCLKCHVDGVTVPRGTYGSSDSPAEFKDDVHFAGMGVLRVGKTIASAACV